MRKTAIKTLKEIIETNRSAVPSIHGHTTDLRPSDETAFTLNSITIKKTKIDLLHEQFSLQCTAENLQTAKDTHDSKLREAEETKMKDMIVYDAKTKD